MNCPVSKGLCQVPTFTTQPTATAASEANCRCPNDSRSRLLVSLALLNASIAFCRGKSRSCKSCWSGFWHDPTTTKKLRSSSYSFKTRFALTPKRSADEMFQIQPALTISVIRGTSRLFESSTQGVILVATTISSYATTLGGSREGADVVVTGAEGGGGGGGGGRGGAGGAALALKDVGSEADWAAATSSRREATASNLWSLQTKTCMAHNFATHRLRHVANRYNPSEEDILRYDCISIHFTLF